MTMAGHACLVLADLELHQQAEHISWMDLLHNCRCLHTEIAVISQSCYLSLPQTTGHRLVGLVVKTSSSGAEDPEFGSCFAPWGFFFRIESYQ